jgi:hypothetical protein
METRNKKNVSFVFKGEYYFLGGAKACKKLEFILLYKAITMIDFPAVYIDQRK